MTGAGPHLARARAPAAVAWRQLQLAQAITDGLTTEQARDRLARHGIAVSHGTVINDLAAVRRAWREQNAETVTDQRARQLALLDAISDRVLSRALDGDLRAVKVVLDVEERRAKLLGLDRPPPAAPGEQATAWALRTDTELRERIGTGARGGVCGT